METPSAIEAIYRRRATRAFTSQPVDDAAIRELLRAAVHAPTAMHLEPWAFVVVQDRGLLARISDRAKALIASYTDEHRALARTGDGRRPAIFTDPRFDIFYGAPTLIVICGKPMGMFVTADCWLAAENLMIAATALGLATCPIGFAVMALADPAIRTELGIPHDITPIAPIIVGHAAGEPPPAARRDPEILSWKRPPASR
ncbi:MAG TPA: nitroreductase family protein [Kofleriaceae bacterium]|nr:nitroreductase family protein [Kofleriaceae bacterium]